MVNQTFTLWIAQAYRHGDNGLPKLVNHTRLPGARGIHNVGMSCTYILLDEVHRNRLEEYLCCFAYKWCSPRFFGYYRGVSNMSDSRTTSYQDQTAYRHRRMEQIWSMQVVGFLDENRSGGRVHGEDTQRTLAETANFGERFLVPLSNQEIPKPTMLIDHVACIHHGDFMINLFGIFHKESQECEVQDWRPLVQQY